MRRINTFQKVALITILAMALYACGCNVSEPKIEEPLKELYLPSQIIYVPEGNDYENNESDFSFSRMKETNNVAIFWHKEYGANPLLNPDESKRFDVTFALNECDRIYRYYVNELKMVKKGESLSDKYKLLVFVFGGDEATAFGGGLEEKVGAIWTPAVRINKTPYGALAHEMAHSFQYLSRFDCGVGPRGPIMEMSAQYMLWQVYPEWMTFENYHLEGFMGKTHFAFLHPTNMYHSPYVLEYWSQKHGKDFYGELNRRTEADEDPVATYKRITNISQEQFNDEIFDASRKFITWDLKRVNEVASNYANQHYTTLIQMEDDWFRIDSTKCPQNYGYNGIKLNLPASGTKIKLMFEGIAGSQGYNQIKTQFAGWRYGFVASLKNGKRAYSPMYSKPKDEVEFDVPKDTEHLWLVVSGAPTDHWPIEMQWGRKAEPVLEEQWPYKIKLCGTTLHLSALGQ